LSAVCKSDKPTLILPVHSLMVPAPAPAFISKYLKR
jgi:hypothetical protein